MNNTTKEERAARIAIRERERRQYRREIISEIKIKIGCDYAHLWDQECGYYQGLNEVDQDCKKLIDEIVERHPVKLRCQYSGLIDNPDKFYKARNGNMVHNSKMSEFSEEKWPSWLPE